MLTDRCALRLEMKERQICVLRHCALVVVLRRFYGSEQKGVVT
jgi:hypothetical protein